MDLVVGLFIGVWFFRTGRRFDQSGWGWAARGVFAFFLPLLVWRLFISDAIAGVAISSGSDRAMAAFVLSLFVGIGCGAAAAVLVRRRLIRNVWRETGSMASRDEEHGVAGPALSEGEQVMAKRTYSNLPTARLEELLDAARDLRPGAAELIQEELERRDRTE